MLQYVVGEDWVSPLLSFEQSKRKALNFAKTHTDLGGSHYPSLSVWEVDENGDAQGHWHVITGTVGRVVRP